MNREMKWILIAVMAVAMTVIGILGAGILRDSRAVRELDRALAESRAAWEDTAERKEALQEDLKKVTEELREAKLTLEESTVRAEELREDIAQLEREIAALRGASSDPEGTRADRGAEENAAAGGPESGNGASGGEEKQGKEPGSDAEKKD